MKFIQQYFWFLSPKQNLFKGKGLYSDINVTKRGNWITLYTGKGYLQTTLNTEFLYKGNIFDWYLVAPWISGNFKGSLQSMLIMGLGGGAQVKYFNNLYTVQSITAVEIDPLIIQLGKDHFNLNDSNLKVIEADAGTFLNSSNDKYDLIILDIFKKNVFDINCQSLEFFNTLNSHMLENGVLLINRVYGDKTSYTMLNELKRVYKNIVSIKLFKSVFFIATNSPSAPTNVNAVKKILWEAANKYPKLSFFKKLATKDISIH